MTRVSKAEMDSWLTEWPVGSKGLFGARVKEAVTVVGVSYERGFPTLELSATTGHTYFCKYGMRRELSRLTDET